MGKVDNGDFHLRNIRAREANSMWIPLKVRWFLVKTVSILVATFLPFWKRKHCHS